LTSALPVVIEIIARIEFPGYLKEKFKACRNSEKQEYYSKPWERIERKELREEIHVEQKIADGKPDYSTDYKVYADGAGNTEKTDEFPLFIFFIRRSVPGSIRHAESLAQGKRNKKQEGQRIHDGQKGAR
jgi:hypothetical protein